MPSSWRRLLGAPRSLDISRFAGSLGAVGGTAAGRRRGPTRSVRRMMADVPRPVGRHRLRWASRLAAPALTRQGYPRRGAAGSRPPPTALRGTNRTPPATAQSGSRARSGTRRRRSARRRTPAATIQPGCRPGVVTGYSTPVEGSTVSRADPRGPGGIRPGVTVLPSHRLDGWVLGRPRLLLFAVVEFRRPTAENRAAAFCEPSPDVSALPPVGKVGGRPGA